MTETSTPAKKAAKKTTKRAPSGPSKAKLQQDLADARAEAERLAKEVEAVAADNGHLLDQLAQLKAPDRKEDPAVVADVGGHDMDRYRELARRPFSSTAMDIQARSVCKDCNAMRGFRDTCQRHQFVNDGQCSWSMPTGVEDDEPLRCPGGHNTSAIHLPYVGHAALTNRLIEMDPGWSVRFHGTAPDGNPAPVQNERTIAMWIDLTICGITHTDVGTAQRGGDNALQTCYGNALRRAGMRHGLGLELWAKGDLERIEEATTETPATPPAGAAPSQPDEELVDATAMSRLNDEVALLADDDDRRRARAHIRNRIKAEGADRKLLTVTEHADAMAYVGARLAEAKASDPVDKPEEGAPAETGQEPPGDAAAAPGPDHPSEAQEAQDGDPGPGSDESDGSGPLELTAESVKAAMFKLKGAEAKQVKTALEDCDLWPIDDHLDELSAIWEVIAEETGA